MIPINGMNSDDLDRYQRQMIIKGHGSKGQLLLTNSKVLIIGAGGLGSPAAVYLAACGVGNIGIVDYDIIELSNLHRQVFYNQPDIGKYKSEVLKSKINAQNPLINVTEYNLKLDKTNAVDIISNYDIIVDGSDNFSTRYLVNDACIVLDKPLVFGAIYQYEGQISIFNHKNLKGEMGPNYRDLYPIQPKDDEVPNCNVGGVIGVMPGIIGSLMAMEVIKLTMGSDDILAGKVLNIDARTMQFMKIGIKKIYDNDTIDIANTDYDYICQTNTNKMNTISIQQLKQLQADNKDFQLIDVREQAEYEEVNMGAHLMPLSELHKFINDISDDKMVIVHCRSGARSASAIEHLTKEHGFDNLYNLEGGILAWLDAQK